MQCLEVSGTVRPIYVSLGVKRLRQAKRMEESNLHLHHLQKWCVSLFSFLCVIRILFYLSPLPYLIPHVMLPLLS